MKIRAFCFLMLVASSASATPCDGVDRSLSESRKSQLASIISTKLNVEPVDILQSYRYLNWHVVYINNHGANKGILYFHDESKQSTYLTIWGGNEMREGKKVVLSNANIIPSKLVGCIAGNTL